MVHTGKALSLSFFFTLASPYLTCSYWIKVDFVHYHLYNFLLFTFTCPKSLLSTHLWKLHCSPESYSHNSLCHLHKILELFHTLLVNILQRNRTNVIYSFQIYEDVLRGIGLCDYRGWLVQGLAFYKLESQESWWCNLVQVQKLENQMVDGG